MVAGVEESMTAADESARLEQAFRLLEAEPGLAVEKAWEVARMSHHPQHVAGVRHMLFRALEQKLFRTRAALRASDAQSIRELLRTNPWEAATAAAAAVRSTEHGDAIDLLFQALGCVPVELTPAY
jgi:hypothetical protein